MSIQNLHTHSSFCDGQNTPEELVCAAIALKMDSLGFSGHSPSPWSGEAWACMNVPAYRAEILRLKQKYEEKISIFLGIEQDMDSPPQNGPWDYVIGSVHQVWSDGVPVYMDDTAEGMAQAIQVYFGGDPYALAEAYYRRLATLTGCQIVGHFDLLTKFNEGNAFFDEEHSRYQHAALEALEALSGRGLIFEMNTGAMSRGYRKQPYPAPFLLQALQARNERICITSDCHNAKDLLYAFPEAAQLARGCGFRETWLLTREGFIPQTLY